MANKYLKKLGRTIGRWAANSLSQDIAIDILAQLSRRLGISSVVASGDAGRFEGHPGDLVFQYYVRQKDTYPELQRLIERGLGEGPGVYIDIGRQHRPDPCSHCPARRCRVLWFRAGA